MKIKKKLDSENHWISVSDLMSVLMMIFLFISISYIRSVQVSKSKEIEAYENNKTKIRRIVIAYRELQDDLYNDLYTEFKNDLPVWNAEIDKNNLSIRFNEPDVLFEIGKTDVKDQFKNILKIFFPRYIAILTSEKYKANIAEIRIEGHTSSEWSGESNHTNRYFLNMELSQGRTRSVLSHCVQLINDPKVRSWTMQNITANGLSFSKPICDALGCEDTKRSRRVEFTTKTNAEKKIVEIIESMGE